MHPKQIIKDIQSMGSNLTVEGEELYIDNPMNLYPEIEQVVKDYKKRIIAYLKGEYSDRGHAIKQTIEKILKCMRGVDQDMNSKIENWLNNDVKSIALVMQLTITLSNNGWGDCKEPFANYETVETDKLSKEIYERSMNYFRKGS